MATTTKQNYEGEPTEAELIGLREQAMKLPAHARMALGRRVLDRTEMLRELESLITVAKARREYEEAAARLVAILPEVRATMQALARLPELSQ